MEGLLDVIFGLDRSCSPNGEYVILWFYNIFIKTNSPSTLNRNGRISKSVLYHTSQQLSQHDCSIRMFPTNISVCIWNKLYASLYPRDVMNMSLFKILNEVWLSNFHGGIVGSLSLFFSDQNYVCF